MKSPVGYHLSLSSDSQFVLYNESSVYDRMHKVNIPHKHSSTCMPRGLVLLMYGHYAAVSLYRKVWVFQRSIVVPSHHYNPTPGLSSSGLREENS